MEKKYIIELPENTHWIQWIMESAQDHHPYMDYKHVEDLTPYTEPDTELVRKEAYEKGFNAGRTLNAGKYEKGLNDAWDAARKIALDKEDGGLDTATYCEAFGYGKGFGAVLKTLTASEAIEKIRQYEQGKEEQDGLRQNIQTIVDQCGYTLDEIAEVLKEMREE